MASVTTISVPSTSYAVSSHVVSLSGLVANTHNGYTLTFTPPSAWPNGQLFTLTADISSDAGVTWNQARQITFSGDGTPNPHSLTATWPGKHDLSANPNGRQVMWQTDVRITLSILQPITMAISGATV